MSLALVGKPLPRVDSLAKTLGKAQYAGDINMPGMLYAGVVRSSYSHALIEDVDVSAASRLPGVRAIVTAKDIPGRNAHGVRVKDQPVLADEKVRYYGEMIAAVAAESMEQLNAALKRITVAYKELPGVYDPVEAMSEGSPKIHDKGNVLCHRKTRKGNIEAGFQQADIVYEQIYRTQLVAHCFLEPEAGVAVEEPDGSITLWVSTQNPHYDRTEVAACLGVPEKKIRIIQAVTGGGFGGKLDISVQCVLALLAVKTHRPVKMTYSMSESIRTSVKRHPMIMRYKMGARATGELTAAKIEIIADTGAYASYGPSVVERVASHCTGAYSIPNVWVDAYGVYTNNVPAGAMRGFGVPQVVFACESHIEALARKIGIDPVKMRLKNALDTGKSTSTGQVLAHSVGLIKCIEKVVEMAGLRVGIGAQKEGAES